MVFSQEPLGRDFFALFGLQHRFALDMSELEVLYRDMQARVHPDKFASAGEADKRLAMQLATHANEAYLTLKSPLKRAQYLLHLAGHDPQIEHNTAMPTDFLIEQMEWREAVIEAREAADVAELDRLHHRMRKEISLQYDALHQALDARTDHARAAEVVRQLMFQEKLLHEIDDALEAVEA
ncbi:Fe-S protein assembly co-chaperone HscB [Sulfurisoma sediminicola]|uniref:Co-chaperone protein HscB homolog n=1 Tax=Sulfurisoma sediminicola TaxID=1381557 RepID=A0A497XCZ3_9PROT|nr:Fe-S protein assembly co-chaperone HscB [Sulfurisoma sediminicola]RLJ64559.1 co-chaperone protein HscB [Sulfurisoma sediminicola]